MVVSDLTVGPDREIRGDEPLSPGQSAFTFMLCWNEFVVAQVLNTKPGTTTLPPVIAAMNGQINIDYSVIAASGFLAALPAVVLVLLFQKYMGQGLTAGSVKG